MRSQVADRTLGRDLYHLTHTQMSNYHDDCLLYKDDYIIHETINKGNRKQIQKSMMSRGGQRPDGDSKVLSPHDKHDMVRNRI